MSVYLREKTCDIFSLLLASGGVWLLLNNVLALLLSLFYIICEFDSSHMEDNVPKVGINQQKLCVVPFSTLDSLILLKTV